MSRPLHKNVCEEAQFSSLFSTYAKSLHDILYYKFGSNLNPQDKVQEAFIKLWENCHKVSPEKAKGYLFTVAQNLMLNEIKHQKVVLKYKEQKPKLHSNETPEFQMESKEFANKLEKALSNLTPSQRSIFMLNRVEKKRHKEIASLLDISVKTVEKHLYNALRKLRKEIDGI